MPNTCKSNGNGPLGFLRDDLIDDTVFESVDEFKKELELYMLYYNEHRPHQGIGAKTPLEMNKEGR